MVSAAKTSGRSLHAEIVARLQESFEGPKLGFGPGSVGEQLQKARQELDEAREKLSDKAAAIADQLLDRMQERGLVVSKELAEASALRKRLATSPNARKHSLKK